MVLIGKLLAVVFLLVYQYDRIVQVNWNNEHKLFYGHKTALQRSNKKLKALVSARLIFPHRYQCESYIFTQGCPTSMNESDNPIISTVIVKCSSSDVRMQLQALHSYSD